VPKSEKFGWGTMRSLAAVFLATVLVASALTPAMAQTARRSLYERALHGKTNEATIGLAAGLPEGAPLRFAVELARVVDDGTNMRILPIVTRGPFENVNDLLYLKGVDAAIIYGDVLEHFKNDPKIGDIDKRINYLMHLFPSELHVFVRPEIKSLEDLAGKPVNFNTRGTAAAYSGPLIFDRLGIKVDARYDPHPTALAEIATSDKYAGIVFVTSKPVEPFVRRKWPQGFKFLPVPLTEKLEEYYLPAQLEASDYPDLVPQGQSVQTISVPAVLAVYNWPTQTDRYRRIVRFIDYLFDRLPRLQTESGFHPKWRDLNLAAVVPGWQRFGAMQDKLVATAAAKTDFRADNAAQLKEAIARLAPGNEAEQNRLLQRFLRSQAQPASSQAQPSGMRR
jgi:NMT1-like family